MDPSQATNTEAVLVASAGENRPAAARLSMVAAAGRFSPATGPMETCRPRLANKPLAGSEPSRTKNRCATIGYGKIALDDKRPITEVRPRTMRLTTRNRTSTSSSAVRLTPRRSWPGHPAPRQAADHHHPGSRADRAYRRARQADGADFPSRRRHTCLRGLRDQGRLTAVSGPEDPVEFRSGVMHGDSRRPKPACMRGMLRPHWPRNGDVRRVCCRRSVGGEWRPRRRPTVRPCRRCAWRAATRGEARRRYPLCWRTRPSRG